MKIFIAGPRAVTQFNKDIQNRLASIVANGHTVLVGDASGVDKLVQKFLFAQNYEDVFVYASNGCARNNLGSWNIKNVMVEKNIKGFDFYACKDYEMAVDADYGFMIWNGESKGTLNNMINLIELNKKLVLYYLPHEKFYPLNDLEQIHDFAIASGKKAEVLFSDLLKNHSDKCEIEQLSLFM